MRSPLVNQKSNKSLACIYIKQTRNLFEYIVPLEQSPHLPFNCAHALTEQPQIKMNSRVSVSYNKYTHTYIHTHANPPIHIHTYSVACLGDLEFSLVQPVRAVLFSSLLCAALSARPETRSICLRSASKKKKEKDIFPYGWFWMVIFASRLIPLFLLLCVIFIMSNEGSGVWVFSNSCYASTSAIIVQDLLTLIFGNASNCQIETVLWSTNCFVSLYLWLAVTVSQSCTNHLIHFAINFI